MAGFVSQEQRPLKKPRLGFPDVYPQDSRQKEDELTTVSVKQGFNNTAPFPEEHGSARGVGIDPDKIGAVFSSIMSKQAELNTFQDTGKKKHQVNFRDNFWLVAAKSKAALDAWFNDLAGSKPLSLLGKKVPIFNKKEEIFTTLCTFNIPLLKAAWFIKMTAAYNAAMQENKPKKRQTVDQSVEWCQTLTKHLKEQQQKVQDLYYGGSSSGQTSFLIATQAPSQKEVDLVLKHWHYTTRLARHMYEEGLLDRQDFLTWLVDLLEKVKQNDDTVLKLVVSLVLQYLDEIACSLHLSRKLAHFCAKKIALLCSDSGCATPRTPSPMITANSNGGLATSSANQMLPTNSTAAVFHEYNSCAQHRGLVLGMVAAIQTVTLCCHSALVWNNLGEGKNPSFLCGSPLDYLPCPPSCLPMPTGPQNQQIRQQIHVAEQQICMRGRAVEVRWSSDKCQQSAAGFTVSRVLSILDILDRHNFDKVDSNNSIDTLYNKIFTSSLVKDSNEPFVGDEPIIRLLIDWAVSCCRSGNHRGIVVAKLMEKRQNDLRNEKYADCDMMDEKESVGSDTMAVTGLPIFQGLLMNFLDEKAPVIDENSLESAREGFHNLIHLFSELIRHDVFSHDAYMCTLISRGDLASTPAVTMPTEDSIDLSSIQSECIKHEPPDEIKMDLDLNMDDDLTNLFKFEHDEMRMSPEQPASVKSMKSEPMPSDVETQPSKASSRHLLYTLHFPIPQDEDSSHECNQRMVVLYGVGKARDDARHFIKKITKELLKMFSKKNCLDMSSGDLGKARRKKERERDSDLSTNLMEGTLHKFQKLSYFDQHYVISHCAQTVLEQILAFNSGNSNYLPQVDNISYLFDLMENALNISSLLEFAVQLLTELSEVEAQLVTRQSSPCGVYTTSLCLCIVGLFRKYHAYLLVSPELTIQVFDGLIGVVKHVINPSDCTSAERCILAHLYDVYTCCSYLKQAKLFDVFSVNAYPQIKMSLYADAQPAASNLLWDPTFMVDYINNAKSQPDPLLVKLLNEKAANRYSFVCNAMLCISNSQGTDRLNDVYILCAELTAKCNMLSSEWLGVLKALCCSANHSCGFIDILTQIEVSDLSIHDSLAVFTAILVARHCFSLQDFVGHVALPSLLAACPSAGGEQDAESGARLTCHLLLRLFKPSYMSISPLSRQGRSNLFGIKSSVDMHLLEAAHDTITVGAVLAMLKAMLVLGDSCSDDNKNKSSTNSSTPKERDILSSLLSSLDDNQFMEATTMCGTKGSKGFMESAGLSDFAKHSLREMCSMKWVRDKILKDPESLFHSDMLLDSMLSNKQAQQLLQMVCYPDGIPNQMDICEPDTRQAVQRILQTLDQWSLRVSWLEMQLMYEQAGTAAEKNTVLDSIAKGTMDLFHQQTEMLSQSDLDIFSQPSKLGSDCCVWLVAPLISKLPSAIQGRVLKLAGQVLEFGNNFFSKSKFDKEKNQKSKSLLGHQPFLSLVLTCLKGQDDQREGLLSSLLLQLERFISNAKDALDKSPDEGKIRQNIHETLQIRLSLVGGMFDTIQRNNATTVEWAQLLLQLISNGVVDMETNGELFTTVLDMLTILILGTLLNEGSEKGEDSKKNYMNLMKKLKRELGDKNTEATDKLRQLLPLSKKTYEVITCEPHGTLVDSKGNKITFDSKAKKQGLQVTSKVTISPWDMIEGHKNMAPLSWTHFGAVRMGKTPLKYENQHRLLLYHNHSLRQPASYFLEPPPLPPEELEPPPEKMEEKSRDHMESHKESNDSKKTKQPRRRRTPRAPNSTSFPQHQPRHVFHGTEPVYQTGPPSNWYPPSQPQQQPQPAYYPQQHPSPAGGPRFGAPQQYTTKQALVNLLHHRQPAGGQGYIQSRQVPMPRHMMNQKQQMIPQRLSGQGMQNRMPDSMYGGNQSTPPAQLRHMGGTHAIGQQNYHQYGQMQTPANQPLSEPTSSSYSQPYQAGAQNSGIMQQPHENYINQQPPQQYSQSSRLQHGMGPTPGGGMSGYSQLPPATSQSPSSYIQPHSQQQQYVLRQQQLMAMKQQQQQTPQQQKTAALVAQLQRQMSHTQPGPAQQYPPTSAVMEQSQYNTYPQPPGY